MNTDPWQLNRRTYDRIAPQFAEINRQMPAELADRAIHMIASVPQDGRILDLGCGAGRDLAWMEAHGARVTGADLSSGMLEQARQIARASLCQMDMCRLGFAENAFHGVWCCAALLHLPKTALPKALAEIDRVLIPGGLLYLSVKEGAGEAEEAGTGPYLGQVRFFAFYTPDEMACQLEESGFHILNQERYQGREAWLWFEATTANQKQAK